MWLWCEVIVLYVDGGTWRAKARHMTFVLGGWGSHATTPKEEGQGDTKTTLQKRTNLAALELGDGGRQLQQQRAPRGDFRAPGVARLGVRQLHLCVGFCGVCGFVVWIGIVWVGGEFVRSGGGLSPPSHTHTTTPNKSKPTTQKPAHTYPDAPKGQKVAGVALVGLRDAGEAPLVNDLGNVLHGGLHHCVVVCVFGEVSVGV